MPEVTMPIIGYGFEFAMSTDGGTTYVTVGEVEDITAPGVKVKDVDISYIQMSTPYRIFQPGLADAEEATFKLIFQHTKYATLLTNVRVMNMWKITFSDLGTAASTLVFTGYINGMKTPVPMDDKVTVDVTIKISGKPVFTAGT